MITVRPAGERGHADGDGAADARLVIGPALLVVAMTVGHAAAASAGPTADQVLTRLGYSAAEKRRVLEGEFVTTRIEPVSERDLTFGVACLLESAPEALSRDVLAGTFVTTDDQVQAYGRIGVPGRLEDFAALRLTRDEADALASVKAGEGTNWSAGEVAAFHALAADGPAAIERQLQRALLARYQSYRGSGLEGLTPYERGDGHPASDPASDLRLAGRSFAALRAYLPVFHDVLLGYPKVPLAGTEESFFWLKSKVRGNPTYVLSHQLASSEGAARAVVRREYFVSGSYNAEQEIGGFLPVEGGSVLVYASHAFTDQVAGAGGALKRSIGTRVMANKMKEMFEKGRSIVKQQRKG